MSRETSVPVPCAADVDYFEHYYAGGISSDGAFEGGYQDVLRLSLSRSVWPSHSQSCSNPPFLSPRTQTCIPDPSELLLDLNAVVWPFPRPSSKSSAPIVSLRSSKKAYSLHFSLCKNKIHIQIQYPTTIRTKYLLNRS